MPSTRETISRTQHGDYAQVTTMDCEEGSLRVVSQCDGVNTAPGSAPTTNISRTQHGDYAQVTTMDCEEGSLRVVIEGPAGGVELLCDRPRRGQARSAGGALALGIGRPPFLSRRSGEHRVIGHRGAAPVVLAAEGACIDCHAPRSPGGEEGGREPRISGRTGGVRP